MVFYKPSLMFKVAEPVEIVSKFRGLYLAERNNIACTVEIDLSDQQCEIWRLVDGN